MEKQGYIRLIALLIKVRGIEQKELCQKTGLSGARLSRFMTRKLELSDDELEKVFNALQPIDDVFRRIDVMKVCFNPEFLEKHFVDLGKQWADHLDSKK